jgi:hypothetical protein
MIVALRWMKNLVTDPSTRSIFSSAKKPYWLFWVIDDLGSTVWATCKISSDYFSLAGLDPM